MKIIIHRLWAHFPFLSTPEASQTLNFTIHFPVKDPKIEPKVRYYNTSVRTVYKIVFKFSENVKDHVRS